MSVPYSYLPTEVVLLVLTFKQCSDVQVASPCLASRFTLLILVRVLVLYSDEELLSDMYDVHWLTHIGGTYTFISICKLNIFFRSHILFLASTCSCQQRCNGVVLFLLMGLISIWTVIEIFLENISECSRVPGRFSQLCLFTGKKK